MENKTIHLQYYGKAPAIEAKDVKGGDTLLWNFGHESLVTKCVKETEKSITFEMVGENDTVYDRRFLKTRLVAIKK